MPDAFETQNEEPTSEAPAPDAAEEKPAQEVPAQESSSEDTKASDTSGETPSAVYEPFNLPEGVTVADEDLEIFTDLGQRYGLPQEGAQELVDLAIKVQEATLAQFTEALETTKTQETAGWQEALKSDEKLGGENYDSTVASVNAFANSGFISESLHDFLMDRGLYAQPEMAGLFATLGRMLQEDSPAVPSEPSDGKTPAQRMFANSTAN